MADFTTRLDVEDKKFDDKIRKAKRELELFKATGNAVASSLKTFAVAVVGADTALGVFDKYVNSTRDSQLEWKSTIEGARTSVDMFFAAIKTGDWSAFENGILNAIGLAKDYIKQLELAKQAGAMGKTKAERLEGERNNYEYLITSDNTTKDEKQQAYEKYVELSEAEIKERTETNTYLFNSLQNALKLQNIQSIKNVQDFQKAIDLYLDPKTNEYKALEEYKKKIDNLRSQKSKATKLSADRMTFEVDVEELKRIDAEINKLNNENFNEMRRFQNMFKGEIGETYKQALDQFNENVDKIGTIKKDIDDAKTDLSKALSETTNNSSSTKKTVIPSGSIAELEKKIQETKGKLNLEVDPQSQTELLYKLKSLESRLWKLKFKIEFPDTPIEELEKSLKQNNFSLASVASVPDFKSLKLNKIADSNNNKAKEGIDINEQYVNSINAVSNALGALSQVQDANAASMLSWAGSVMTATALAIQEIKKLIAAKTAEGAAAAGAEAAKTPFVGWLLVGGAIATALAAFASIPSFNDGGIFQSPFTTGDKNLARLNGR